jgi:hypothetical protein
VEQYWNRLERHLRQQDASGGKVDSAAHLAVEGQRLPLDGDEDKVVVRFSRGKWEVAYYGIAKDKGLSTSRHASMDEALQVARVEVHSVGLRAVGARYGRNAAPGGR